MKFKLQQFNFLNKLTGLTWKYAEFKFTRRIENG